MIPRMATWRGTVGVVKPTFHSGSLGELIKLLPDGIEVIPLFVGFQEGSHEEFSNALPTVEAKIEELARIGVDLLHPEGAPPFMILGPQRERELLDQWRQRYGVPVFTSSSSQVEALNALGVKRMVGVTYTTSNLESTFGGYFTQCGFEVLGFESMPLPLNEASKAAPELIYTHTRDAVRRHKNVDGVYMLGSGWRALEVVDLLEQDLEIPVIAAVPVRVWAIQNAFGIRERHRGYGRLLSELPRPRG
jgi:maleate cis-trans isomerase